MVATVIAQINYRRNVVQHVGYTEVYFSNLFCCITDLQTLYVDRVVFLFLISILHALYLNISEGVVLKSMVHWRMKF